MGLTVRQFRSEDAHRWDEFVREHVYGSPFHLTAWKSSIESTFGYEPIYLLAEEGSALRAVLPLFLVRNLLMGKVLISSPFAVYGGILGDSAESRQRLAEYAEKQARDLEVNYLELRNAYPEQCAGFTRIDDRYVTFVQQLGSTDEEILQSIPRKTRAAVRKALQYPYSTRVTKDLGAFEDLYGRSLRRLGTPSFPSKHFKALIANFGAGLDIREIVLNGRVVAAVMSFYFGKTVLPYYGSSDSAFNSFAPNNYMYYDLMRSSMKMGHSVFDFGRSKREGSGSFDFKAHWGMEMRALPYEFLLVKSKELPHYSPNNPKFHFAVDLWRRVPLPVTRILGPALIRLVP